MQKLRGTWNQNKIGVSNYSFNCGFCGAYAGPSYGYQCTYEENRQARRSGQILLCPSCNRPTFIAEKEQTPGVLIGDKLDHLPTDIEQLYDEARKCISFSAHTSAVLSCRKLLMNVSVTKGAAEGKNFAFYVNFLEENHFMPPGSKGWVDHIRKKGNEATHEIPNISQDDAEELIKFTEILLRFVYEMPGKMKKHLKE